MVLVPLVTQGPGTSKHQLSEVRLMWNPQGAGLTDVYNDCKHRSLWSPDASQKWREREWKAADLLNLILCDQSDYVFHIYVCTLNQLVYIYMSIWGLLLSIVYCLTQIICKMYIMFVMLRSIVLIHTKYQAVTWHPTAQAGPSQVLVDSGHIWWKLWGCRILWWLWGGNSWNQDWCVMLC